MCKAIPPLQHNAQLLMSSGYALNVAFILGVSCVGATSPCPAPSMTATQLQAQPGSCMLQGLQAQRPGPCMRAREPSQLSRPLTWPTGALLEEILAQLLHGKR